jgi:hypothetical protein
MGGVGANRESWALENNEKQNASSRIRGLGVIVIVLRRLNTGY